MTRQQNVSDTGKMSTQNTNMCRNGGETTQSTFSYTCDLLGVDVAAVVNARRRRARDLRRTGITGTAAGVLRRVFRHHYIRYDEVVVYVRHYSSTVTWHSTTAHGFRHQDGPTGQVGGVSRAPFTRVSLDFHSCTTFFAPLS
jgi:hypothetical protein